MSVLFLAEHQQDNYKKSAFEAATFSKKLAEKLGTTAIGVVVGKMNNAGSLGKYGADKVIHIQSNQEVSFDSQVYTEAIAAAANQSSAKVIILAHSSTGKALGGRLSAKLKAGLVSGVNALPDTDSGFKARKSVFSGKAQGIYNITSDQKILTLTGNAVKPVRSENEASVETLDVALPPARISVKEVKTVQGIVPLPEAEIVVSAGRGMKDPGNWGIIEELAATLGATTACSRPVADADWRPHHEHVGQTGIAIRPNLYFAIGISGAIQHLAGVNTSKVIVVINKDPEAPFFKAADYGVVGDLFEVVPKLNEALKAFKAAQ